MGLLLVGVAFVGLPDGAEIVNLAAAVLMAGAMIPYGIELRRSGHAVAGLGESLMASPHG